MLQGSPSKTFRSPFPSGLFLKRKLGLCLIRRGCQFATAFVLLFSFFLPPSSALPFSGVLFPAFVLTAFLVALSVFELSQCCLSINCVLDYASHESSHALIRLDLFTLRFISVAVPAWASKKDLRTFCLPLFRHETQATFRGLFRVCSILP